ncbi:MAG: PQQ-dependent sugar dehydrogenase [Deltaproteobacteria bacterium]|nr:PQQ-dependent sugar dehydrogenase [Deltaproteobacteria bacterium]
MRPGNTTCLAPARPPEGATVVATRQWPTVTFANAVAMLQAPGDATQFYVVEKAGRVRKVPNTAAGTPVVTFLDMVPRVSSSGAEAGLLGLAFHPDWQQNRQVFLSYTGFGGATNLRTVISRVTSGDAGATLDPATEQVLLTLEQPYANHTGGGIAFGPDGLLYIGLGDGGSGGDPGNRAQNVNALLGKFLRIDVDGGTPYGIPADNPFASGGGLPEIYALGLRNPWRWSFDLATGDLWAGDVGQNSYEEVDIIRRGGNYGWRFREGLHCYNPATNCPSAGLVDPVVEYPRSVGSSITGGYVYRGSAIPELRGVFLFADFVSGRIMAAQPDPGTGGYTRVQLLASGMNISSFAQDHAGEVYLIQYGTGGVHRLDRAGSPPVDIFPARLSQTGCVSTTDPRQPAPGLIPFSVAHPLWSDGADKERFLALPDGETIDVDGDGDMTLPVGSVLVKNFRLAGKLIETRLFMRHPDGNWGGYSYEWDDAETDATLLPSGKNRTVGALTWSYPSRVQCMQCHTAAAGRTLGVETLQLNTPHAYPNGRTANQLMTWEHLGLFTAPLAPPPEARPVLAPVTAITDVTATARSYLHVNCSQCHRPGGTGLGSADYRFTTPWNQVGACGSAPTQGELGIAGAQVFKPGVPAESLIPVRMNRRDIHGMPPVGSNMVDSVGVALMTDWITATTACP